MSILFRCPHCQAETEVPARFAGREGPCRECGALIRVPGVDVVGRTGGSKAGIVFQSGFHGALYAALMTLLLVTLPELGSPVSALVALVRSDPADADYQRRILGHLGFLTAITLLGAVLSGSLIAVLGTLVPSARALRRWSRGAAWGCGAATLLAGLVVLVIAWTSLAMPSPSALLIRLGVVFACGFLGALLGTCWAALRPGPPQT